MKPVNNSGPASSITTGDVVKYMTLPRILPRLKDLFGTGFAHFAFFMALVYRGVRLLPQGHPYTLGTNVGRFGTMNVISEAANHLVFKRENIDQIIIFFTIIAGMILLCLQIFSLMVAMFFPQALASVSFVTPNPQQDIAFMLLDRVFGVPNLFNSCVTTNSCLGLDSKLQDGEQIILPSASFPWPFHLALHALFQFYSIALLVVGVIILMYYVFAIVAETAQTGTPFGKRFNSLWAPIRIVVAFGLLIPIGTGLNAAQYIVLYSAKLGSGMATNGWLQFNQTLNNTYFNSNEMVAKPSSPKIANLVQFMVLAKMCQIQWQIFDDPRINPNQSGPYEVKPYLVKTSSSASPAVGQLATGSAAAAYTYYGDGNGPSYSTPIEISYGVLDPNQYKSEKGSVLPVCGRLTVPIAVGEGNHPGATVIRDQYYALLDEMWNDGAIRNLAVCFVEWKNPVVGSVLKIGGQNYFPTHLACGVEDYSGIQTVIANYKTKIDNIIKQGVAAERAANKGVPPALQARGWAGAGIFYNLIAEMNGAILGAAWSLPNVTNLPTTMEIVYNTRKKNDQSVDGPDQYDVQTAAGSGRLETPDPDIDAAMGVAYSEAYKTFSSVATGLDGAAQTATGNVFLDVINGVFGTDALFQMRDPDNAGVHPLAQLSALGKGMIDATIRNIGAGVALTAVSIVLPNGLSSIASTLASFAFTLSGILLTAGFILYYVVPFLPFIYFFFAVGSWIKTIFEAMVGAPLWALAHIRIDGDGLPGQAALGGYYLIFEIFLRPILTVFGLLASILIFAAMVAVLNDVFDLVIANLSGRSTDTGLVATIRGPIDQLFFTILYAIIVYMIGTSSFKMIDQVPQSILRWMGSNVTAFADQFGDQAAGQLTQYATIGSGVINQQVAGNLSKISQAVGRGGRG